jgi:26S proteasome regulatory subunit N8
MLVVYLSSLLRAVIALHALVDNKASIGRAEFEEGGDGEKEESNAEKKGEKEGEKKDTKGDEE